MIPECVSVIISKKYNQKKREFGFNANKNTNGITVKKLFEDFLNESNDRFNDSASILIENFNLSHLEIKELSGDSLLQKYIPYIQNKTIFIASCASLLYNSLKNENHKYFYGFLLGAISFEEYTQNLGNWWKKDVAYFCEYLKDTFQSGTEILKVDQSNIDSSSTTNQMHTAYHELVDWKKCYSNGLNVEATRDSIFKQNNYYIKPAHEQFTFYMFKEYMQRKFYKSHDVEQFVFKMFAYDNHKSDRLRKKIEQIVDVCKIIKVISSQNNVIILGERLNSLPNISNMLEYSEMYDSNSQETYGHYENDLIEFETKSAEQSDKNGSFKYEICESSKNDKDSLKHIDSEMLEKLKKYYNMVINYVHLSVDGIISQSYCYSENPEKAEVVKADLIETIIKNITNTIFQFTTKTQHIIRKYSIRDLDYAENCALFSEDDDVGNVTKKQDAKLQETKSSSKDTKLDYKKKISQESKSIIQTKEFKHILNIFSHSMKQLNTKDFYQSSLIQSLNMVEDNFYNEFVVFMNRIICMMRVYNVLKGYICFYDYVPDSIEYNSPFYVKHSNRNIEYSNTKTYTRGIITKDKKHILFPGYI